MTKLLSPRVFTDKMDWSDFVVEVPNEETANLPRAMTLPHRSRPSFHKQSAYDLLLEAFGAGGRVDFPTVTEICDGVAGNVHEMAAVAQLLSAALQKCGVAEGLQKGSDDSILSLQLKALTVANELLYDADARRALIEAPGLLAALKTLKMKHVSEAHLFQRGALRAVALSPAVESVRLLTSEICLGLDITFTCRL